MEIEILQDEKLHKQFLLTYTVDDVQECIQKQAEEMQPDVKVNGFRPGKVPTEYIIRIYGEKIRIDAMNQKVTSDIKGLVEKNNLDLAVSPIYKFRDREETADTNFYLEVDFYLFPEVPEFDFSTVKLEKFLPDEKSLEEIVDKNLVMLQVLTSDFKEKVGEISENDKVSATVKISVDGTELDGIGGDVQFLVGHEQLPQEVESQFIGMISSGEKEFEHSYAEDAKDLFFDGLAGKTATFHLKVNSVQAPEIQDLNDEKLKLMGFSDAEQLLTTLRKNTQDMIDTMSRESLHKEMLNYIRENFEFDIPEIVLKQEANQIAYNEASLLTNSDAVQEALDGVRHVETTDEHRKKAKNNLVTSFVLMDYSRKHNIVAEENEVKREMENHFSELQRMNKMRPEQKEKNYSEFTTRIRMLILERKIVSSIIEKTSIQESFVSKDDFFEKVKAA